MELVYIRNQSSQAGVVSGYLVTFIPNALVEDDGFQGGVLIRIG